MQDTPCGWCDGWIEVICVVLGFVWVVRVPQLVDVVLIFNDGQCPEVLVGLFSEETSRLLIVSLK